MTSPPPSSLSAELYSNTLAQGCGHSIPWDPYQLVSLKKCPQCRASVSFVQSSIPDTSQQQAHSSSPVILFRMGTNTFLLWVSPPTSGDGISTDSSTRSNSKVSWWPTSWGTTANLLPQKDPNLWCLDQIAQQMKLHPQFKLLHKGTLLYPPKQGGHSTGVSNVSRQLLDISQRDWTLLQAKRGASQEDATSVAATSSSSHHSFKVSLVLMGTLQGEEIRGPPSSHPAGTNATGIVGLGWWMFWYVSSWVQYGVSSMMGFCWMFLQSIASPPETLPSDDAERSSVRRRRRDAGGHDE